MSPTDLSQAPQQVVRSDNSLLFAWVSVVLIPAFLLLAVIVSLMLYEWFGYKPENADAPLWVDGVIAAITLAICLVPCWGSVLFGRRAVRAGNRWVGMLPLILGGLAAVSLTVLTIVSTLGPF